MRTLILIVALVCTACTSAPTGIAATRSGDSPTGDPRLIGTWLLQSTHITNVATGQVRPDPVRGSSPRGILTLDADGYMANQVMDGERVAAEVETRLRSASGEDGIQRALGYSAYYGRYTVDRAAGTVSIRAIDGVFPTIAGQVLTRDYRLEGDRLTLSLTRAGLDGQPVRAELVWRKAR